LRKLFAIAFTCVYLLLTVGVAKTTHYCMGRERSFSLFTFQSEFCCPPFAEKADFACCNDSVELIKLEDDQQVSTTTFSNPAFEILYTLPGFDVIVSFINQNREELHQGFIDKPPRNPRPLYSLHSSRIFYES
jgi:hypothetical protein